MQKVYRNLVSKRLHDEDNHIAALPAHPQQRRADGIDAFRKEMEALTNRAALVWPRGRPKTPQMKKKK